MCSAGKNHVLAGQETFNKTKVGMEMLQKTLIKVKGKDDMIMTYTVEKARAALKNQRLNATGETVIDLHDPVDFFTHVASYITCSLLDCILSTPHGEKLSLIDPLACILVMNFDEEENFAAAIQFPLPLGGIRLTLQGNGGDIISYAQTSPTNFVVTALFSSKPGESLVCTRESSDRTHDILISDAMRSIMQLTKVKSFGFAVGPVTSEVVGHLWMTQGPAVVDAHEAAVKALSDNTAVVAASSCGDEALSFTSFPLDREARVSMSEAAFSQMLHICVRQKRTTEFEKINKKMSASLPLHAAKHLEAKSLLGLPMTTKSFALQINATLGENEEYFGVVDNIASFMTDYGGSLLSYNCSSGKQLSLTAIVSSSLEAACFLAVSLSSTVIVTSSIEELSFGKPFFNEFYSFPLNSNDASLCHKSIVGSVLPSSSLMNFGELDEDENYLNISSTFQEANRDLVVGREVERNTIDTALNTFLLDLLPRQMVLVEGLAGHGKSTLTNEFANKVKQANGVTLVMSEASSMRRTEMLEVWVPIFYTLLERTGVTKKDITMHIRENLPDLVKKIALLNHVLPDTLRMEAEDEFKELTAAAARAGTIVLCESFFRFLINKLQFVVLVIENIHWASSLELRLLISCCSIESGLMVVLNTRTFSDDDLQFSDFKELQTSMTELITLASFSKEDVEALVKVELKELESNIALLDRFIEVAEVHAKGLPLLVHKLLDDFKLIRADAFFSKMDVITSEDNNNLVLRRSSLDNARAVY